MAVTTDSFTRHGAHDASTRYGEHPDTGNPTDSFIEDGAQDAFTKHGEPRIAGVDWDKPRAVKVNIDGEQIFSLSPDEFIDWYNGGADGVDAVCFERPHLRPRGKFSRAQIWTADDLEKLTDGPPILMPNGKKISKMAREVGNTIVHVVAGKEQLHTNKELDSQTIRLYAETNPNIMQGWKRFVPPSQDTSLSSHDHRNAMRQEISETINEWRELWQDVSGKDATRELEFVAPAAKILDAVFDDLSDNCKEVFSLTRSKGTVNLAAGRTRVMTVYAMAFDRDNQLRTYKGRPLGRRYLIKDVVGLCDSYMPNMARANLTGYGKNGRAGADRRTSLNRAVRELLRAFQTYGDSATRDGGR